MSYPFNDEYALGEKCPNTEFILVRLYSDCSVFSPNKGKYRPEKTPYLDTFHAVTVLVGSK